MKLYLSSYKLGNTPQDLVELINKSSARLAVIDNALDYTDDPLRRQSSLDAELFSMKSLGFHPEHVDLREYFDCNDKLLTKLGEFDGVWVRGGNSFILRKAMAQSGFDGVVEHLVLTGKLTYAGYSAALAVIAPSLNGIEFVDDMNASAPGYNEKIIWDGYGLIDFYPIVHYKSNHPESSRVDMLLEYVKSNGYNYRTLRDGEVIVIKTE